MTKNNWLSIGYALTQLTAGLLLHPYQTMQSLIERRVFIWMTMLPTGMLMVVTISWRYLIVPLVRSFFSCQATGFIGCNLLNLAANWLVFFCIYWQLLLFYLLIRFKTAFGK